jgi:iron(III) transport system permease protein
VQGFPVTLVVPPGTGGEAGSVSIFAGAPNPDLARQFVDFVTGVDAQQALTDIALTTPLQLTGTGTIIVIRMVFSYLPVGYRIAAATLQQLAPSIEESAADMGASSMRTFVAVVLSLIGTSFSAALVYCFVKAIGTLSAVVFLISHGNVVTSASIPNLAEQGYWGWAAALATMLITAALLALALAKLVLRRSFAFFDV